MNPFRKKLFLSGLILWITQVSYSQKIGICDTIRINNQVWTTRNLDVEIFQNGDTILHAPTLEEWKALGEKGIPAWAYYNNDLELGKEAGRLYNWYAASDKRGIAPKGWRVPTNNDVQELLDFIGRDYYATSRLASKSWKDVAGSDEFGFNAKPYGMRFVSFYPFASVNDSTYYNPKTRFEFLGEGVGYWLSDLCIHDNTFANVLLLNLEMEGHANVFGDYKENGFYIRCIKEED